MGGSAQGDAARCGEFFYSRGDLDAIAEYVIALDNYVTQIDADAHLNALICRHSCVAFNSITLAGDCTSNSIDDVREHYQCSVTHQFDHAAVVLGNSGTKILVPQSFNRSERTFFVLAHEPRKPYYVGN